MDSTQIANTIGTTKIKPYMRRFAFLKESIQNIKTVGTITRSSRYLSRAVVKYADLNQANVVVELGAGDGVMTRHILDGMKQDAVLFSFEINPIFSKQLLKINDPRLKVINISAEKLIEVLGKYGYHSADAVLSALPFTILPDEMSWNIINKCHDIMKQGAKFVQIHYSMKSKHFYRKIFKNVDVHFELRNIPPAFIMISEKKDLP